MALPVALKHGNLKRKTVPVVMVTHDPQEVIELTYQAMS
jgi:ABC-type nitrate/sulfonate/bicarbonate transport system ATPase subunit